MNTKYIYLLTPLFTFLIIINLSAQCISGDCQNGKGTFIFADGSRYEGAFSNGEIHGFGICDYADGSTYTGSWQHRLPHGDGKKTYADGTSYDGLWEKGLPVHSKDQPEQQATLTEARSQSLLQFGCLSGNCDDGLGTYAYPDGSRAQGTFVSGMLEGQAKWFYPNGTVLKGHFKKGLPHGDCTVTFEDVTHTLAGTWVEGEFVMRDQQTVRPGCVEGDCQFGKGTYVFSKGTALYVGEFSNSVPDGYGKCFFVNGNVYQGYWFKGSFHGQGTLALANGTEVDGQWRFGNYQENMLAFAAKSGVRKGNPSPKGNGGGDDEEFQYLAMEPPVSWHDFSGQAFQKNQQQPSLESNSMVSSQPIEQSDEVAPTAPIEMLTFQAAGPTVPSAEVVSAEPNQQTLPISSQQPASDPLARVKQQTFVQPKVWAVVVGISSYHHMPALRYTDDDAYRIFAFLKSPEGGGLPDEQIRVLVDENATKENIITSMMDVFYQAGPQDLVVMYFSGHGLKGSFLPFDFDGYNNKLYHHEVNKILKNSPANFKLCIADACHSGSLLSVKGGDLPSVLSSYYNHLAQMEPGSALLMSSKSEELSLESSGLRQGVFTHFLIRGLKGEADADHNGAVCLEELYKFVTNGVQKYTRYRQTPLIKGEFDHSTIVSVVR